MREPAGFLWSLARRLLRETGGANTLEAALFAGAVVATSALAFSATTGAMSRAFARVGAAFGTVAAPSLCDRSARDSCGPTDPGESQSSARSGLDLLATVSHHQASNANDDVEAEPKPPPPPPK